jgi:hypothetical protein
MENIMTRKHFIAIAQAIHDNIISRTNEKLLQGYWCQRYGQRTQNSIPSASTMPAWA